MGLNVDFEIHTLIEIDHDRPITDFILCMRHPLYHMKSADISINQCKTNQW